MSSCTTNQERKVSLKLMVSKTANKVVFAEAGEDCLEFISHLLSLPLSTVANILHAKGLGLVPPVTALFKRIKSTNDPDFVPAEELDTSLLFPRPAHAEPVKDGGVTYMVMDNLDVKPMSLPLIKPYVHRLDSLEERLVQVGSQEALRILKASFETDAVLTNVFLGKKTKTGGSSLYPSTAFRKLLYLVLVIWFVGMLAP